MFVHMKQGFFKFSPDITSRKFMYAMFLFAFFPQEVSAQAKMIVFAFRRLALCLKPIPSILHTPNHCNNTLIIKLIFFLFYFRLCSKTKPLNVSYGIGQLLCFRCCSTVRLKVILSSLVMDMDYYFLHRNKYF